MDKVKKVLEGKAVLKVVDVDPPVAETSALEERMSAMSLGGGNGGNSSNTESIGGGGGCVDRKKECWMGERRKLALGNMF